MIGEYIGNYRLTRLLGEGGMGMVYQAVHDGVGGQAAIKILRPEVAQKKDATTRLFNEARAANSIPHPGIVRIFDCGYTSQGVAYLAMEYLAGESLRARIDRERSLSVADAVRIARQIASVLQAAHSRQVVHRDLKPDNIMLVPDPELPGGERVKLLDFGVAKLAETLNAEPMLTRSDMLMGTPTYMAPEQCRGAKHVTDRSDVYSLGVILYQMLAGAPPFAGDTVGELIAMHLTDSEPALTEIAPHVDPEICTLVHLMLRKKPTERPSVEAVAQELKRLLILTSQAEGMSPVQARRMASETAIALLPPLSPEAQALLRGNTAPPTLSGGDSGPTRTPQPAPLAAVVGATAAAARDAKSKAAGASQSTMGRIATLPQRQASRAKPSAEGADPALSSTWDGDAFGRLLPPGMDRPSDVAVHPLAVTDRRIDAPLAPAPVSASASGSALAAVSGSALASASAPSDPEATPPLASVPPAKLTSADTPKRGELTPAGGPSAASATPARPPLSKTSSVLSWSLGALLLVGATALVWSLVRSDSSLPATGLSLDMAPATQGGGVALKRPSSGDPHPKEGAKPSLPIAAPVVETGPDAGVSGPRDAAVSPESQPGKLKGSAAADSGSKAAISSPVSDSKSDAKKAALLADASQSAAWSALRAKQYAEAQRQSQGCIDKQPNNYRCWWMLGIAACQQGDASLPGQARGRLLSLGRAALAKEVDAACTRKTSGQAAEVSLGSLRLRDDKEEWLNTASGLFESGRYQQAQALAEKNVAQSPTDAWLMIGRTACALGNEEKANDALNKVKDRGARGDIVYYCVGKGFAYSLSSGILSKREK